MYSLVTDSGLKELQALPKSARKLVDGEPKGDWVVNLKDRSEKELEEVGIYPLVEDEKPTLKSNQRLERNVVVRYGKPVVEWKVRNKNLEDAVVDGQRRAKRQAERQVSRDIKKLQKALDKNPQSLGVIKDSLKTLVDAVGILMEERNNEDA